MKTIKTAAMPGPCEECGGGELITMTDGAQGWRCHCSDMPIPVESNFVIRVSDHGPTEYVDATGKGFTTDRQKAAFVTLAEAREMAARINALSGPEDNGYTVSAVWSADLTLA